MNFEELNRYVLIVIGLFAGLMYTAVLYVGFAQIMAHLSKKENRRKRTRNRDAAHGLRNSKGSIWGRSTRRTGGLTLERKR